MAPRNMTLQQQARRFLPAPVATLETELGDFFCLPQELRDVIYDILHQHKQQAESGRMTFRFPLTHVRNISRRFTREYDLRTPATRCLVVSQEGWSWGMFSSDASGCWGRAVYPKFNLEPWGSIEINLPLRRPRRARLGGNTQFTGLEFNFDIFDETRVFWEFMEDFYAYSSWISEFLYHDDHMTMVRTGRDLHLRLCFSYFITFDDLKRLIRRKDWFSRNCSKISLVLYSSVGGSPNETCLSKARVLAIWTRDMGWLVEEEIVEECRAERNRARQATFRETTPVSAPSEG